ncbi:MAG: hypothetical protein AB2L14_21770 [Candidatus Xenobiia bacterium LiM19]
MNSIVKSTRWGVEIMDQNIFNGLCVKDDREAEKKALEWMKEKFKKKIKKEFTLQSASGVLQDVLNEIKKLAENGELKWHGLQKFKSYVWLCICRRNVIRIVVMDQNVFNGLCVKDEEKRKKALEWMNEQFKEKIIEKFMSYGKDHNTALQNASDVLQEVFDEIIELAENGKLKWDAQHGNQKFKSYVWQCIGRRIVIMDQNVFNGLCVNDIEKRSITFGWMYIQFYPKIYQEFINKGKDQVTAEQDASDVLQDVLYEIIKLAMEGKLKWYSLKQFYSFVWKRIRWRIEDFFTPKAIKFISIDIVYDTQDGDVGYSLEEKHSNKDASLSYRLPEEIVTMRSEISICYQILTELESRSSGTINETVSGIIDYFVIKLKDTMNIGKDQVCEINYLLSDCDIFEFKFPPPETILNQFLMTKYGINRNTLYQRLKHLREFVKKASLSSLEGKTLDGWIEEQRIRKDKSQV